MNSAQRYRKISPNEWLYLSCTRHFGPFAVQLLVSASILPSVEVIRAAVARAAANNPGACLVPKGRWWLNYGIPPKVRYLPSSERFSLSHPVIHATLQSEETTPLEIICWEGTGILFRCSHALMDAGGLLFFAEEVFRALRGESLLGSSTTISDWEYVKSFKYPKVRRALKANYPSPLGKPASEEKLRTGFIWERRIVPGKCVATAARLTSAITHLQMAKRTGTSSRFMFPVDLRNVDPTMRTTGNLSNPIFLDMPGAIDWNDAYARTLEAFSAQEERATSPFDAIAPMIPLALLGHINQWEHDREVRNGRYLFSALISNLESISLDAFSCSSFAPHAVCFLPFDAPGSALTLITVQHDHGLEIAASCPAATGHSGKLAQTLDMICSHLKSSPGDTKSHDTIQSDRPVIEPQTRLQARPQTARQTGPQIALPSDTTVCSLIIEQAAATPEQIALVDGDNHIDYREMLRRALAGAKCLQAAGVLQGDKVAILSTRSSETIVTILAIFFAGAAFVPIDPDWPTERMQFVLDDCQPRYVIAAEHFSELISGHRIITLASLYADAVEEVSQDFFYTAIPQTNLAYVLYTSGSTGKPKGVKVGHESLLNYVLWCNNAYLSDLDMPCVFPLFTSLAFDLTLTSIFLPLTTGGAIHAFHHTDPLSAILAILADPAINAVKLTPSHLWLFASAGLAGSGIRKLIVGGEALPVSLAKDVCTQIKHQADIYNEYGPTEATVGCIVHRFDAIRDCETFVPIGLPIANTEVLILDEQGRPLSDGTVGEIALAGRCLALGYLARPEEDVRFGTHPFDADARIYRTGDSGRRRPDGEFDYRGRIDEQVKIRGHRVELGEIEAAMEQTGLCSALAVLSETAPSGMQLTAYVVWRTDACEDQIRRALAAALPAYMIPRSFVALENLPLNVNGKIDKPALRMIAPDKSQIDPVFAKPIDAQQDMEEQLVGIVAGLGGVDYATVPLDRSLLELGLDSLQMMLLLTLAAKRFLPDSSPQTIMSGIADFLRAPTIVNLAAHLRQAT